MPQRTATGPNGEKVVLQNGEWVPLEQAVQTMTPSEAMKAPETAAAMDRMTGQAMKQGFGSFLANALSIPHGAGKLLAAGGALPALVPGGETFTEARARGEKQFPAAALLAIPDVSTEEVLAVPKAIGRAFSNANANARRARELLRDPNAAVVPLASTNVPTNYRAAVAEEEQIASDNPVSTSAGRTAGDVATLLTLRPGQRLAKALNLERMNPRASLADNKGVLDAAARTLQRGLGRTAEAGFDGAVMGALGDADPVKTAAWSAGVQAGGSAALAAKNAFLRNPIKSFVGLYLGHEMFKALAPGPQDAFESKDAAVQEMVAAYGLGVAAAIAGSSRGVGTGHVLRVTDALSSASRATIASVVTQLQEAAANNQPQYARVLELMSQDQQRFGTDARVLLERAARSEEPRALLNQIDALMQSARFRKALEEADTGTPSDQGAEQPSRSFADYLMRR